MKAARGQHDELEAKIFEGRVALEAKYQKHYAPLYNKIFSLSENIENINDQYWTLRAELANTEEYIDGQFTRNLREILIRCIRTEKLLNSWLEELNELATRQLLSLLTPQDLDLGKLTLRTDKWLWTCVIRCWSN